MSDHETDGREISGVHSLDDLARKMRSYVEKSEQSAKKGDRLAMVVSITSLIVTVAVLVGGWLFWGGGLSQRVDDHERRISSIEAKVDGVATKEDVRALREDIRDMRSQMASLLSTRGAR